MSSVKFAAAGAARFAGLIHDTARDDEATARRHTGFIASHVLGGCAALLALPVYLAIYGQPTPLEALAFAWFVSPIAVALYLSRSGQLAHAQLLSAANMSTLVAFAAALTGGLSSFLLPWMAVAPLEAALSMSRRAVAAAIAFALAALTGLAAADLSGLLPPAAISGSAASILQVMGVGLAILYAGSLALSINRTHADSDAARRKADESRRNLAEAASDLILRHSANGMVTIASNAAERLLNVPAEELIGDGLLERVHIADRPSFLMAFSRAATKGATTDIQIRLRRDHAGAVPDAAGANEFVWAEMRCRRVAADNGATEIVSVIRDITHQKQREETLASSRDEAEEGGRARARFLAGMNHELRTPLNAIIGFADVMCEDETKPLATERQREYAQIIRDSGYDLLQIVNDIVDVSRLEAGSFELRPARLDMVSLVKSCSQAIAKDAKAARVKLDVELPGSPAELVSDARACQLVLHNVFGNALAATPAGGAVRVVLRDRADMLSLQVESTGGKPKSVPEDAAPVREAGRQGDATPPKTGILGLAMLNNLVGTIGGTLDTGTGEGGARRITVELPKQTSTDEPEVNGGNIVPFRRSA